MNAVTAKLFFRDKSEVIHRYEKRVGHRAAVCGYHLQMVAGLMFWSGIGGVIVGLGGWAASGNIAFAQWALPFILVMYVVTMSLRVYYEGRFYREASRALGFKVSRKDPLIIGGVAYQKWCDERGLVPWGFGQEPLPTRPDPEQWPGWPGGPPNGPTPSR